MQAPPSLKHQASPVAATKKTKTVVRQRESKIKPSDVPTSDEREGGERGEGEEGDGGGGRGGPRPSTPPPKEEAFEQFKKERGSEINKILLSNKGQWVQIYKRTCMYLS